MKKVSKETRAWAQVALAIIKIYADERALHWFNLRQMRQIEIWLVEGR